MQWQTRQRKTKSNLLRKQNIVLEYNVIDYMYNSEDKTHENAKKTQHYISDPSDQMKTCSHWFWIVAQTKQDI